MRCLLRHLVIIAVAASSIPAARAYTINGLTVPTPAGASCSISSLSTSVAAVLSSACTVPSGTICIVAQAYGATVNWRDDGTAPVSTPGTGGFALAPGQFLNSCAGSLSGGTTFTLANFQFIGQASGGDLFVAFYK